MRPRAPREGDKRGRQVGELYHHAAQTERQSGKQVEDNYKIMRPRAPRAGDKRGRQVGQTCKSMRAREPGVRDKCGRQMQKVTRPRAPKMEDK